MGFLRDLVNAIFTGPTLGPVLIFTISVGGVLALLRWYRVLTRPRVAGAALAVAVVTFALSLFDHNFRLIVAKPDNVPIVMLFFFVGFFTWLAMRQAAVNDERIEQGKPPREAEDSEKMLTWPDLVYIEFLSTVFITAGLLLWSILLKAPLEPPSNPTETPNPSKAPWYFLGLQEMLVYYDPWMAGVVLPSMIIVGLIAVPFIDPNTKGSGYYTLKERKFAIGMFLFGFVSLWCTMIILGTFLRGPNWNFFGPFQRWDPHLVFPLVNVDLSEYVWVLWLGVGKPNSILLRELPGILAVLAYVVLVPPLFAKRLLPVDLAAKIRGSGLPKPLAGVLAAPFAAKAFFAEMYQRLGFVRYNVLMLLVLSMMSLPIKMVLRWTINLKYIVSIPEYFFNI